MTWCIYRITNLINGKTYIGQHRYKKKKLSDAHKGKHWKLVDGKRVYH